MKVLIIFAHLRFEKSLNQQLPVKQIPVSGEITFHDLYELYRVSTSIRKQSLNRILWDFCHRH